MPGCADQPLRGGETPAQDGARPVSGRSTATGRRGRGERGCLDHHVAHQFGVDREDPHPEHGGGGVEQTARRQRRRRHREGPACGLKADRTVAERTGTAGEGEGVAGGLGIGEEESLRHPP